MATKPQNRAPKVAAGRYFAGQGVHPDSSDSEEEQVEVPNLTQPASTAKSDHQSDEQSEDEEELRRRKLKERLLQRQKDELIENITIAPQPEKAPGQEIVETSSEYSSSEEEEYFYKPNFIKPVFVPKINRETVNEKQRLEKELEVSEAKRQNQLQQRKIESSELVMEVLRKEMAECNYALF
jgi:microfibrillar-associated protein 1